MKVTRELFPGGTFVPKILLPLILVASNFTFVARSGAQAWATNSPMLTPRWSHTATALTNGTVLITGGTVFNDFVNNIFETTNDAEIYNPATGVPSLTAFMNDDRASQDATLLTNGQVLVTGGGGDRTSETYDPGSASWINLASMHDERTLHVAVLLTNGQVLAAGGINDNSAVDLSSAEIYNPGTATWTSISNMPYAADSLAGVLLANGTVLVCGGNDNGSAVSNAVIYHPNTQTWSNTASMHEARGNHGATLLRNGKVLVEGGTGDNSAEIYDPATATWTLVASMNDGRDLCDAILLTNGEVMVSGDSDTNVDLYDPVHDAWSYTASLPTAGYNQTETLMSNGWVVVTGGDESQYNGPATNIIETFSLVGMPISGTPSLTVNESPSSGGAPLPVQFTSPGVDSKGNTVTNWSWTFGDGGTSKSQSPLHTYTNAGSYTPSLIAFSTYGSTQLVVNGLSTITVTNLTISDSVTPTSGQVALTCHFTSANMDSGGNAVTNWSWTFGDGGVSTVQNPSHTYTVAGTYHPALTVFTTYGGNAPQAAGVLSAITVTNPSNPLFRTIYNFSTASLNNQSLPTNSDGTGPNGDLLVVGQTIYGIAGHGGLTGYGDIFAINASGSGFTNLYTLSANKGGLSGSGLTLVGSNFYGTTSLGGNQSGGTVFSISTNGTGYTNLYLFSLGGSSVGSEPTAGVVFTNSMLYGMTVYGGQYAEGAIFAASTSSSNIVDIHSFLPFSGANINSDGLFPFETLILAGPTLYGTTEGGGTSGSGTVFSINTNSPYTLTTLHYFSSPSGANSTNSDGAFPYSGLVLVGTNLYGTTYYGGTYGYGTVFAVSTNGFFFTNLYSFTGGTDGANPKGGLVAAGNMLYGDALDGGAYSNGCVFALSVNGTGFTNLYSFTGGNDGQNPAGHLTLSGSTLYGVAAGGSSGEGVIYSYLLPAPKLYVQLSGTNAILTWSTLAPGYTLQSTPQIASPVAWSAVLQQPVIVNGLYTVTNPASASKTFYRLAQ